MLSPFFLIRKLCCLRVLLYQGRMNECVEIRNRGSFMVYEKEMNLCRLIGDDGQHKRRIIRRGKTVSTPVCGILCWRGGGAVGAVGIVACKS